MSSELDVRWKQSVRLSELAPRALNTLQRLLDSMIDTSPYWLVVEVDNKTPVQDGVLDAIPGCPMYIFKLAGYDAVAGVTVLEVPIHPDYPDDPNDPAYGWWINIGVSGGGPLDFAIIASLAIELARISNTSISDHAQQWCAAHGPLSAEEFFQATQVKGPFASVQDAAQAFHQHMYIHTRHPES